jgi:hypothetical protein
MSTPTQFGSLVAIFGLFTFAYTVCITVAAFYSNFVHTTCFVTMVGINIFSIVFFTWLVYQFLTQK